MESDFGGMEMLGMRHLTDLEVENWHIKQMYAETSLEWQVLKDIVSKSYNTARVMEVGGTHG